jgi:Skp family chaperone for outer membrane proteins
MTRYTSYSKKYGYWRNPLEIEAREAEKKHFNNLYKHIKKIYNEN